MADDKSTLTRRRVLGGMATIGVAGALGAGAWAGYSDTETANITAQAGTLDLVVTNNQYSGLTPQNVTADGNTIRLSAGDIIPGEKVGASFTLDNKGTVEIEALGVEITNVNSGEGINTDSETNTTGTGELDNQLYIAADYDGHSNQSIIGNAGYSGSNPPNGYVEFNTARTHGPYTQSNIYPVNGGHYLHVQLYHADLPENENNRAQGDELEFDLKITGYQNPQ